MISPCTLMIDKTTDAISSRIAMAAYLLLPLGFVKAKIILVDGEMFSWYGSRLLLAPAYFTNVIAAIT